MNDVHVLTTYPEVYSEEKMTDVFPEARLHFTSGSATAPVDFSIENGKSYIVYFDYVDYKIDAANGSIANNLFSISVSDGTMTVSASDGYHTVGVTACETTYNKLPAAYYEDGGVSSWNDLTDKPFGDNEDGTVYQMSGKYVEGMGYVETGETETIHPIDPKYIVLTSPNGTKYNLSVADDGTLSAVAQT